MANEQNSNVLLSGIREKRALASAWPPYETRVAPPVVKLSLVCYVGLAQPEA